MCLSAASWAHQQKKTSSTFTLLPPSRASLLLQNQAIDQQGLYRVQNEKELKSLVDAGVLVPLSRTDALRVAPSLPVNRRYVLPQVNSFLRQLSEEFYYEFGQPLVVDSAVRPAPVQSRLRRFNHSAAPVHGETASSHEAGCTVDLSKHLSRAELNWLRYKLWYYQAIGWAIVEDERNCIHIMVIGE